MFSDSDNENLIQYILFGFSKFKWTEIIRFRLINKNINQAIISFDLGWKYFINKYFTKKASQEVIDKNPNTSFYTIFQLCYKTYVAIDHPYKNSFGNAVFFNINHKEEYNQALRKLFFAGIDGEQESIHQAYLVLKEPLQLTSKLDLLRLIDKQNRTPIFHLSIHGHQKILDALWNEAFESPPIQLNDLSLIYLACIFNQKSIITKLFSSVQLLSEGAISFSSLLITDQDSEQYKIERQKAILTFKDNYGYNLLHLLVIFDNADIIDYLLLYLSEEDRSGYINMFLNATGETAIHIAASYEREVIVKLLCEEYQCDMLICTDNNETAAEVASCTGNVFITSYLLEKQAEAVLNLLTFLYNQLEKVVYSHLQYKYNQKSDHNPIQLAKNLQQFFQRIQMIIESIKRAMVMCKSDNFKVLNQTELLINKYDTFILKNINLGLQVAFNMSENNIDSEIVKEYLVISDEHKDLYEEFALNIPLFAELYNDSMVKYATAEPHDDLSLMESELELAYRHTNQLQNKFEQLKQKIDKFYNVFSTAADSKEKTLIANYLDLIIQQQQELASLFSKEVLVKAKKLKEMKNTLNDKNKLH